MIIGISGKIGSGKDTLGKIIQHFTSDKNSFGGITAFQFLENYKNTNVDTNYQIKKFADKLKDIVCLLINCTREQLEDETFKNTELGEEWWSYIGRHNTLTVYDKNSLRNNEDLVKPTPRLFLQLLGTEAGRNIIHPNIWINSLFSEYKPINEVVSVWGDEINRRKVVRPLGGNLYEVINKVYPNWIITDLRFKNEFQAIKNREGIVIRVNRNVSEYGSPNQNKKLGHVSETNLDNANFDYVIENESDIQSLIEKVKLILIKEQII